MFFERKKLNPNNQKYLDKIIEYKLQYVIYGFTTTVLANLISLAILGLRVKSHFQLRQLLVSGLTERKLLMPGTIITEVYVNKEQKIKLAFTSRSVL